MIHSPQPGVSRETTDLLAAFSKRVIHWNRRINLVSRASISNLWSRHIADSLQLVELAPKAARSWIDLGSGGGFPGIVIAIAQRDKQPDLRVIMVESDQRKAVFLREACRELELTAVIVASRIETAPSMTGDVISARALAPLPMLLGYAARFSHPGSVCLFPKGKSLDTELTLALSDWNIDYRRHPSTTDPEAAILEIKEFRPRL